MKKLVEDLREICSDLEGLAATESNLGEMRDAISSGFSKIADSIEDSYKAQVNPPPAPAEQPVTGQAPTPAAEVPKPEPPASAEVPAAQ